MTQPFVTLHHGDCLEVLPTLDQASIGAVVTDPPYGINYSTDWCDIEPVRSASWRNSRISGDHDSTLRDWIVDWSKNRNIPWAVFGNWKCQRPPQFRGVLIWDKGPGTGMGDLSFPWKMSWEEIYIGGPGWHGKRDEGVLRDHAMVTCERNGRMHPNQKPVSLLLKIIEKLPPDITVLDPFAGSGSTGVACLKAGRNCILIESDSKMIPIIERRLKEAETPLFSGVTD